MVWLDKDGQYTGFVDDLKRCHEGGEYPFPVHGYRGSFLELMLGLETASGREIGSLEQDFVDRLRGRQRRVPSGRSAPWPRDGGNGQGHVLLARRLSLVLLAVTAPVALVATRGHAAEPLTLAWSAPEACPSREVVLAEVRRLLGGKIVSAAPVSARGALTRVARGRFRLEIAIQGDAAERPREVVAPTCAELGDAAALILALAIDPTMVAAAPPASPDPEAPPPPPAPAAAPSLVPDAPDPAAAGASPGAPTVAVSGAAAGPAPRPPIAPVFVSPPFALAPSGAAPGGPPRSPAASASAHVTRLHALATADLGTFREPAAMLRAGGSFSAMPLRLEAAVVLAWGGRITSLESATKGGEFWLAGGALAACYEGRVDGGGPRPISAAGCAGLEADAMVGASYGVSQPGSAVAPWLAPLATGLLRWEFTRGLALRLDLSLAVPAARPAFRVERLGLVHQTGYVVGRAGAGVEVEL